jgi:hypothetical protein
MNTTVTKHVLAFTLSVMALVSLPAKAELATQCSIDHAVSDTIEFQQCPSGSDAILADFDGVRLDAASDKTRTPIWAYDECRYVDNMDAAHALFIPLKSYEEWKAFFDHPPATVHLAGCCLPRPMNVGDVPTPPTSGCQLKGLVDTTHHKKLIATPISSSADAVFALASGVSEDSTAPISEFPVNRDDISAVLPDNANPAKAYTALYSCGDKLDYYIDFRMQCAHAQWSSDSSTKPETSAATYGKQTTDIRSVASSSTTTSCTPLNVLTTTPCPDPTAGGIITLKRIRVCDGSNNGAGTTTETVYANNCQPSGCVDSEILTTSQTCQGGAIVKRKVFNSCTKQVSTVTVSNTCQ